MSYESDYTTLDLLRHGQLETPGILCADANAPLSKEGMDNLYRAAVDGKWDIVISSPQQRCAAFAKKLAEQKQCNLIIDEQFKEMNFGDWVGIKSTTLWQKQPEKYQQLWHKPDDFIAPNGESMRDFYQRVQSNLNRVLEEYRNQTILLVTHAGVIRSILAHALEISSLSTLKFDIAYAQMSRLRCYHDSQFSLEFLGKAK